MNPKALHAQTLAGLTLAGTLLAAVPLATAPAALAMESTTFAGDAAEAAPVVSVRVEDKDPADGVCTGTAISEHWVITARHCVEAARKPGGSVRTGQGDDQKVYKVDRHEVAPRGDIALLHTEQPMQLDHFAEIADAVPTGDARIYGWSSDGSGGSKRLPSADAVVEGESELALFGAPTALKVALKNGARIQPGDSGGAIFADGKVAGVMSAGLFADPDNPTKEEITSNAAVAVAPVADQAEWIRSVVAGGATAGGAAAGGAPKDMGIAGYVDATETGDATAQTGWPWWAWALAALGVGAVVLSGLLLALTREQVRHQEG